MHVIGSAAVLRGMFEQRRRITLGDAIRAAETLGLDDDDARAAMEHLTRPRTAQRC